MKGFTKYIAGSNIIVLITITIMLQLFSVKAYSLQGSTGSHDPTAIIKCDNTYWIFTTGDGIYSMYSSDLINWRPGQTPYTKSAYPAWINDKVPGFTGTFWAPEIKFMNGKYYLYYSCSTWGSKVSCIGLATNESLNPSDPDYGWKDEGVVVFSNQSSDANCIDPAVFQDNTGQYWITYGSYFGGIRSVQIDSVSGKVTGSYRYPVASGSCEAAYVIPQDDYYYLFINRGSCCSGVNSTYHIQVGRSESPSGPFLDLSGADLNSGGGTTILNTDDNFIGPGHAGYFVENGMEWFTYHYYDGDRNGAPTLGIATIKWREDGWPTIQKGFVEDGAYKIVNRHSNLVWQAGSCEINEQAKIVQSGYDFQPCQQWEFTAVRNGYYTISPLGSPLMVQTQSCSAASGANLVLDVESSTDCDLWRIERTNAGEYIISSRLNNDVVNVPSNSFDEGTNLEIANYTYVATHYWKIQDTLGAVAVNGPEIDRQTGVEVFPNPASGGHFTVSFPDGSFKGPYDLEIYSLDGRLVASYKEIRSPVRTFSPELQQNIYLLKIRINGSAMNKMIIIN